MITIRRIVFLCSLFLLLTKSAWAQNLGDYVNLIEGIREGDRERVDRALESGVSLSQPDATEEHGFSQNYYPLDHAIDSGQIEMVRYLLESGADLNQSVWRSLALAIRHQDPEMVRLLLAESPDMTSPDMTDIFGQNVLVRYLLLYGNEETLEAMDRPPFDWSAIASESMSMSRAMETDNIAAIGFLLANGANPNASFSHASSTSYRFTPGSSPLADAAYRGASEVIELLLEHGADPDAMALVARAPHSRPYRTTPLIDAVRSNNEEAVKTLLDVGVDVDALDGAAIRWSDLLGNPAIYQLLRDAGATERGQYSYHELPQVESAFEAIRSDATESNSNWNLISMINQSVEENPSRNFEEGSLDMDIAILPLSDGLEDAVAMLSSEISVIEGLGLVERENLSVLAEERWISQDARFNPESAANLGNLVGADSIIFMRSVQNVLEVTMVNAHTGLTCFTELQPMDQIDSEWSERIVNVAVHNKLAAAENDLSDVTLLSLPIISPLGSSARERAIAGNIQLAMAQYLGKEPSVFLLARSEMDRLKMEKSFSETAAAFYQSGIIVDGQTELLPNNSLQLTIRVLRPGNSAPYEFVQEMPLAQLNKLTMDSADKVLDFLNVDTPPGSWNPQEEAEIFLAKGNEAFKAGLWSYAFSNTNVAAALGTESLELTKLRLLSAMHLLYRTYEQNQPELTFPENWGHQQIKSLIPLEFPQTASGTLSLEENLETALTILDILEAQFQGDGPLKDGDIDIFEHIPGILYQCTLPLRQVQSLSSVRSHKTEIASLQRRLDQFAQHAILRARQSRFGHQERQLIVTRSILLPYWISDETDALEMIRDEIRVAHENQYPYVLQPLMNALYREFAANQINDILRTSRQDTFAQRRFPELAHSELAQERLLGLLVDVKNDNLSNSDLEELLTEALIVDSVVVNNAISVDFGSPPSEFPTQKTRGSLPAINMGLWFSWQMTSSHHWMGQSRSEWTVPLLIGDTPPQDQHLAGDRMTPEVRQILERLLTQRLEYLAEAGPGHFVDPGFIAEETELENLELWLELANQALDNAAGAERLGLTDEEHRQGMAAFERSVIDPLREAHSNRIARQNQRAEANIREFVLRVPLDYKEVEKNRRMRRQFRTDAQILGTESDSTWLSVRHIGLFRLDSTGELSEFIPYPEIGVDFHVRNFAVSPEYISVRLDHKNAEDSAHFEVFDRKMKTWNKIMVDAPEKNMGGIWMTFEAAIVGDYLFYNYAGTGAQAMGGASSTGDWDSSIVEMTNIQNGERFVVVNTRRMPPTNVHEGKGSKNFRLRRFSDQEVEISGFAYNIEDETWRKMSKEDRALASRRNSLGAIEIDGHTIQWVGYNQSGDTYRISVSTPRNSGLESLPFSSVDIPKVNIVLPEVNISEEYSYIHKYLDKLKSDGLRSFDVSRNGVLGYNGLGFVFIPREEFIEYFKPYLEAKIADYGSVEPE